jgi:uncharacterized protein (DUF885 family)
MKPTMLAVGIFILCSSVTPIGYINFNDFRNSFVKGYSSLNIPQLQLSYAANFQNIQSLAGIEQQTHFFQEVQAAIRNYKKEGLTKEQNNDLDLIGFETNLHLERLSLERDWRRKKPVVIPINDFHNIPDDSAWYVYYLKRWLGADVNPDELYLNGIVEIESVQKHINDIRLQTGMDSSTFYHHLNEDSFFLTSQTQVQKAFENTKSIIQKNLSNIFSVTNIPDVEIKRGTNKELVQTPGYYSDNTFYYNYWDSPYNKRQVDWLFIHEAVPGHHYQTCIASQSKRSDLEQLFWYPGFSEGWAAYCEELGKQLGVYRTPYDELGKWEWDLVRSVRVPLDIGINYYGWDDAKALAFWKQYIPGRDDIAMREINRIHRWPVQVITYKYGAEQIMKWRKEFEQNTNFNIKTFHEKILEQGSLPFFLIERNVRSAI